jgi:D-alanyl-D-alanine dipeptidase/kynurenine formamidase
MRHARVTAAVAVAIGTLCAVALGAATIGGALAVAGSAAPAAPSKTKATGPPVETGPMRAPDLVEVITIDPSIRLDIRYATAKNFTGRPVYREARAFLQRPAAEALARVSRALADKGYGLTIFDGYRPWSVTKTFWDITPDDQKIFVADPAEGSKHNRGCAVDLTLHALADGREVAMPSEYDETSPRAYATYDGGAADARQRRDLLRAAMEREGFFVYPYEWWHFDYKDWREYPVLDLAFDALPPSGAPTAVKPAPGAAAAAGLDLSRARLVDLTWPFDASTLYWPTSPSGFELKSLSHGPTAGGWFYSANTFCAPEHGGTHLDAPIHFSEKGRTTDQVPLEQLIGPAVVIDVRARTAADPDYRLTAGDLRDWEAAHGTIPKGAIVLLRTGWGDRWPDRRRYLGDATPGDASHLHFPSYGREAAEILVGARGVAAIGVDTASIDYGASQDFIVHQVAMRANVPGLENVAHLEALPETGAFVAALPMKIAGGSGGPARIVAFIPDSAAIVTVPSAPPGGTHP